MDVLGGLGISADWLGKDVNPFWDELKDRDFIQKNPQEALRKWKNLSEADKTKYYLMDDDNGAGQALRDLIDGGKIRPNSNRGQAIGAQIQNNDQNRKEQQDITNQVNARNSFLESMQASQEKQAELNRQDRLTREAQLDELNKKTLERLLADARTPEQRLNLTKNWSAWAAQKKFEFVEKENKLQDDDFKMKLGLETQVNRENALLNANINQAARRENNLYELSASNLANQLSAFVNMAGRSNEALQTLSNAGKPNYSWIR